MKRENARKITLLLLLSSIITAGCSRLSQWWKSEYATIEPIEITSRVDALPDNQRRTLAQSMTQRKELIEQFKKAYALAQAAEAEGLHKSDAFQRRRTISENQALAAAFSAKNDMFTVDREALTRYLDSHRQEFDADYSLISGASAEEATEEQKELVALQWAELRIRADKGREAGLDKTAAFKAQMKFSLANILANLFTETLDKKIVVSDEEKRSYLAQYPEADLETLRGIAQQLLDQVKAGASFEQLADQNNMDGTRGAGGQLDWLAKGQLDPEFEKVAFALRKGEVAPQLVRSKFGFHVIRLDDRRPLQGEPNTSETGGPAEEIRARHIFISTQEADLYESKLKNGRMTRAMEDVTLNFPVNAPRDFAIKVEGLAPFRAPRLGGGASGVMRPADPRENR
ncbi:MAG: peptidylprolyl isomerase [Blastocatellia bacterium]